MSKYILLIEYMKIYMKSGNSLCIIQYIVKYIFNTH